MKLRIGIVGLTGIILVASGCGTRVTSAGSSPSPSHSVSQSSRGTVSTSPAGQPAPNTSAPTRPSGSVASSSSSWTYAAFTNHGPNGSFTLSIPRQFTAQAPPTDHDGRTWTHGPAKITAFSEINAAHEKLASFQSFNPQTTHITYQAQGLHWRVASGVQGSTIVYAKVYFLGPDIFSLTLTYPQDDQRQYGTMVTRVAESFVPSVKP